MTAEIRAAGGVVLRDTGDGPEVLLVHRIAYDDWSFPKGKVERGEEDPVCALREVAEETGLECELEAELPETRYTTRQGPKVVRWWRMRVIGGGLQFDFEVDAAEWLAPDAAAARLTYSHDRELLRTALAGSAE